MNDKLMDTDDLGALGEIIQGASYILGQAAGLEIAAKKLREKSGTLYARGRDLAAKTHRQIAEDLEKLRDEMQLNYDTKYREQSYQAFERLDELRDRLMTEELRLSLQGQEETAIGTEDEHNSTLVQGGLT